MSQLEQAVVDATLSVEAAQQVLFACLAQHDAAVIGGTRAYVEQCRAATMSAMEALLDRKAGLIHAQLRRDGIDPLTRKLA